MVNKLVSALLLSTLAACSTEPTPSQVYAEYTAKVIEGISYADDMRYYSQRKQQEVEARMPDYMKQMKKTREEAIQVYLDFSREVAKCKEITLQREAIEDNTAVLVYSQTDICGNASTGAEKQTVKMIREAGWKIDEVEISL